MSSRYASVILAVLFASGCRSDDPGPGSKPSGPGPRLVAAPPLPASGRVIDISQPLSFGGIPDDAREWDSWLQAQHAAAHLTLSTQTGTIVDAPALFDPSGRTVDALDPGTLIGPAVVIDLRPLLAAGDPDVSIDEQELRRFEEEHGPIPGGAIVLMLSGWDELYDQPEVYLNQDAEGELHFPGFSAEAVRFLLQERNIRAIGVDTPSIDLGLNSDLDAHKALLGAGKYAIENLRGLDRLPPLGATLIVAPLRLADARRAPARVLAVLSR